jgi:hypothetical protein
MNKPTNYTPLMLLIGLPIMLLEIAITTILHIASNIKTK